jgi:23S rRNA (cytidine1920-2'-O)/16S rRNA (cytidine1409-2'-O)-methyltransferase
MKNKIRADLLIQKQFPEYSLNKIHSLIIRKQIYLNNNLVLYPGQLLDINEVINIKKQKETVSRGSFKLKQAIEEFRIEIKDKECLDIGSSAGGFIYTFLEKKARKVYGLDSGTNQLDYSLRNNTQVEVKENFSFNKLDEWKEIHDRIEIISIDISFNSITNVFKKIKTIP